MSYDVTLRVKVEGIDKYIVVADNCCNITWNVRELIKQSSGWDIKNEASNGPVKEWEEKIYKGVQELKFHPEKYKKYEAPNGWGTVQGTLGFYQRCLEMVKNFEEDWYTRDLMPVAIVWVE